MEGEPTGSITGWAVYNHFSRPPMVQAFFPGPPVEDAWVWLNEAFSRQGVCAAPADPATGGFTITGIPAGTYQLVTWDKHLDSIFGFNAVTIPDAQGNWDLDLGDVLTFAWFGTYRGTVFYDEDGFRDPEEVGIPGQETIIRFRDGTIYQAQPTDIFGEWALTEVFPFFKWLVLEIDFLRYKDTGFTNIVDNGGEIPPDNGWVMPSRGVLNPQPQFEEDGVTPLINPNTGNNLSRTESGGAPGEFLLQAMHLFLSQTNIVDWGKVAYGPDENGGISGLVYYAVTRAEDDPAYAAAEGWEPGIPRVRVNLYQDAEGDKVIDDLDDNPGPTLIVNEGDEITVNLTNELSEPVSIIFPGQEGVTTTDGSSGLLTAEAAPGGGTVSYSFTASQPGTYMYHSGSHVDLQVEMGLVGALIVRPAGFDETNPRAYSHADSAYDHEYLFFLTEMDYDIHLRIEFGLPVDTTTFHPVYWFINGRNAPDTMLPAGVPWLPYQPYNCLPRMHPGERLLMRVVGAGRDLHPYHHQGNNALIIARDGRLLESAAGAGADLAVSDFTLTSVPGQTLDAIFEWTGKGLGWDIYGHDPGDPLQPYEYAPDHGKPFPVILPDQVEITPGGAGSRGWRRGFPRTRGGSSAFSNSSHLRLNGVKTV